MLFFVFAFVSRETTEPVASTGLLRLTIEGNVIDSLPNQKTILDELFAEEKPTTSLRTLLDALKSASFDPNIKGIYLDVSKMGSIGLASARTLGAAIDDFKRVSGKEVLAWSANYTQGQYIVATHASRLYMHPMGEIELKGLSSKTLYWGEFLKNLGIGVTVYKAGEYKSAPEVFTEKEPSKESIESQKAYMDVAWSEIKADIERSRALQPGSVDAFLTQIASVDDLGKYLKAKGFVTDLIEENAFRDLIKKEFNLDKAQFIPLANYASYIVPNTSGEVAVLTMEGEISNVEGVGGIFAKKVVSALKSLSRDPQVKALVLRINSPGGDALAAEMIRFEVEKLKNEKGIPVVVSMADTAASGGYWISTAADFIVADPLTLTGSIGVFAISPDLANSLSKLGIGYGGYKTGEIADLRNPLSCPSEKEKIMSEKMVLRVYDNFKELVAKSRNMSLDRVEANAGGRVWIGSAAKVQGLVDDLGTLDDAIRIAMVKAKLPNSAKSFIVDTREENWLTLIRMSFKSEVRALVRNTFGIPNKVDERFEDFLQLSKLSSKDSINTLAWSSEEIEL